MPAARIARLRGRNSRRDQQRAGRERDHHRRPQVGLRDDQQTRPADDHQQRVGQLAQVVHALRALRQQRGGVQHERQLHQLRRLELQWTRPDPAPRTVHAHPDVGYVHREHEHKRDPQQRRGDALDFRHTVAREQPHQHQPHRAVHHILHEIPGPVALTLQQASRRGGAIDHHRAERQQTHRGGQQDPVLERPALLRGLPVGASDPFSCSPVGTRAVRQTPFPLTSTSSHRSLLSRTIGPSYLDDRSLLFQRRAPESARRGLRSR